MIKFRDFVPRITEQAGLLKFAEYETFDKAVEAADQWINENAIHVIQLETVVLPNIWSPYEEGTTDSSLGTRGGGPSHWHQFLRVWYDAGEDEANTGEAT